MPSDSNATPPKSPWSTKTSRVVYDNDWIKVEHHEVINPGGNDGIYGKVHFKNYAIGIIPLDEHNNTWLVGQYRYPLDEYSWEIPMGGGLLDESILAAAKRELKEETGIVATQWESLLEMRTSNCVTDEKGFVFIARGLSYGDPSFDETEDLAIKKLPLKEAYEMVLDGSITDSISMAALLKLKCLRY